MYLALSYSHDHTRDDKAEQWSTITIRNARKSDIFSMPDDAYDIHLGIEDVEYSASCKAEALFLFNQHMSEMNDGCYWEDRHPEDSDWA